MCRMREVESDQRAGRPIRIDDLFIEDRDCVLPQPCPPWGSVGAVDSEVLVSTIKVVMYWMSFSTWLRSK
jgi:hypothetical protein